MNSRYLAYAAAHGTTAEAIASLDAAARIRHNAAFMAWIVAKWTAFRAETKRSELECRSTEGHVAFDAWLAGSAA